MTSDDFEIELLSTGTHAGVRVDDTFLRQCVANGDRLRALVKAPVRLGHSWRDSDPSVGWITGLRVVGNKLLAKLSQVPGTVRRAIKQGLYKRASVEMWVDWSKTQFSKNAPDVTGPVVVGAALLGAARPQVQDLADLDAYLAAHEHATTTEHVLTFAEPKFLDDETPIIAMANARADSAGTALAETAMAHGLDLDDHTGRQLALMLLECAEGGTTMNQNDDDDVMMLGEAVEKQVREVAQRRGFDLQDPYQRTVARGVVTDSSVEARRLAEAYRPPFQARAADQVRFAEQANGLEAALIVLAAERHLDLTIAADRHAALSALPSDPRFRHLIAADYSSSSTGRDRG